MTRHIRAHHKRGRPRIERMSSLDAVFLAIEDRCNPMNIGSLGIFEGPSPDIDELREFIASRISRVPRCRQRVRVLRGPFGRPVWIDDSLFDIRQHVLEMSLVDSLSKTVDEVVADVMATRLDRHHPLWRIWIIRGMPDHRWAVITQVHHCMVDGIAGNDLLGAILADTSTGELPVLDQNVAPGEPTALALARFTTEAVLRTVAQRLRGSIRVFVHPVRSIARVRSALRAAKSLWYRQNHRATSLVGPIGERRTWARTAISLKELQSTADSLDCTVNDLVLSAVSHGLRQLLADRGEMIDGRTVTAMVPVSLRSLSERGDVGNRIANVHALLPVGIADPSAALRTLHDHLESLKVSGQVDATGLLMSIGDYIPRIAADRVARAVFRRQRNVQIVITNVPGPTNPHSLGTHRMVEGYPIAPIGGLVRMTIAAWSYCGNLSLGLTADFDSTHDIDRFAEYISHAFAQFVASDRHR